MVRDLSLFGIYGIDDDTKNIVVVWSGGCDSTALLWNIVEKYKEQLLDGRKHLVVLSVESSAILKVKNASERKARTKLLRVLKKKFGFDPTTMWDIQNNATVRGETYGEQSGLPQPVVFISSVLPFIPDNSVICFGYISGDCAIQYEERIHKYIQAGLAILERSDVRVAFPLKGLFKEDIIAYLKDREIYDMVWWCEGPREVGVACNSCIPCQTHNRALISLAMHENNFHDVDKITDFIRNNKPVYVKEVDMNDDRPVKEVDIEEEKSDVISAGSQTTKDNSRSKKDARKTKREDKA